MENILDLIGTGEEFLNRTLLAQPQKPIVNKWQPIEKLLHAKEHYHLDKAAAYRMGKVVVFCFYRLHK